MVDYMKKTSRIEIRRMIKKNIVPFIAIFTFVCLGIALYVGLAWAGKLALKVADDAYENTSFHDIEVTFPFGLSKKEINSLYDVDGVDEIEETYKSREEHSIETILEQVNILVIVYVTLAVIIAFLVLYNQYIMLLQEKKKEIIVLKINGYSNKYAKKCLSLDTLFLTIIGIILGIFLGNIMADFSIKSIETGDTMYLHGINLIACLIGVAGTGILSLIMSSVVFKKIKQFDLTDVK